ncbi:hypothetical protein Q5H93_22930 [Hymenobacter sp. ASUV-10]|uniref:Type II toxin-antitoxin system RelE/ParE family toxin n=1 Tax=Hymenobacter aranciens TaxID=3063996 RepID=A0ABT9BH81_9BACT|nr:hypothetical protein [Hymenobacter sp. ASUV-10]MDO7877612.1 hypothetical protein [Hymenobacter sp. ASUV-10]
MKLLLVAAARIVGKAFTLAIFTFCQRTVAPLPWAYPAFSFEGIRFENVRRAVFRKHYVLLYRVTDTQVLFLDIFHTAQRPTDLLDIVLD